MQSIVLTYRLDDTLHLCLFRRLVEVATTRTSWTDCWIVGSILCACVCGGGGVGGGERESECITFILQTTCVSKFLLRSNSTRDMKTNHHLTQVRPIIIVGKKCCWLQCKVSKDSCVFIPPPYCDHIKDIHYTYKVQHHNRGSLTYNGCKRCMVLQLFCLSMTSFHHQPTL